MPDLRYVCVSDLHLGAENSLLTRLGPKPGEVDVQRPSEVLEHLAACLREIVPRVSGSVKPTLMLNGDALELALAEDNIALMAFERFLEVMFPENEEPLFDSEIIFNPGNHDHHLWETAREKQYADFVQGKHGNQPGAVLPPPWHTTNMFNPDLLDSLLLNTMIDRHPGMAGKVRVKTVYPNMGVLSPNGQQLLIFSHGHYVESIYKLMTTVGNFIFPRRKPPEQIWDVETENFAWVDFFWSAMGRSGAVGKEIGEVYDMLLVPTARKRLIRRLARTAGHHWIRWAPKLGEWIGLLFVPFVSRLVAGAGGLEKRQPKALTRDAKAGLRAYLEGPVAKQIVEERGQPIEAPTTFIFGHTHKPFSESLDVKHFSPGIQVYNSGGWVVDTQDPEPTHGGAVILVDEEMNAVSLRMYNETEPQKSCPVRIEAVNPTTNPFYSEIASLVTANANPWLDFSQTVAQNVPRYHQRFRSRLSMARKKSAK